MLWFKLRKDKLMTEDNVAYIAYGMDAYSWLKKVKSIPDISLDKKQMIQQIKAWNRCRINLKHLKQVVESFVEDEATVKENPYSRV